MMKFFWFFFILFTIASLIFAMTQKTCEISYTKNIPIETCEHTTPIGKWAKENLGISF